MNWLIENWYLITAGIAMIGLAAAVIVRFFKLSTNEQAVKIKEWLLWAVTQAEAELGSGTGRIKLSMVYDMFILAFGWTAKLISFEKFSALVDEALEEMRNMLSSNRAVQSIVYGIKIDGNSTAEEVKALEG